MALPLFVHGCIDDMTDLTPNAMRVYMHLARRADADGMAWPSYQSIGDHCFKSVSDNPATRKSFARRALDELIEANLISKQAREREDGGQTSNGYSLSTVERFAPPHAYISTPMPNTQGPCLIDPPHAYEGTNNTPIEVTPKEERERAPAPVSVPSPEPTAKKVHVKSTHLDPRHFVNGYIPEGTGATAVEVYYERFSINQDNARLNHVKEDDLARLCPDLDKLREVVTAYSRTSYQLGNMQLILDWYNTGIPDKNKPPGQVRNGALGDEEKAALRTAARLARSSLETAQKFKGSIDPSWQQTIEKAKGLGVI